MNYQPTGMIMSIYDLRRTASVSYLTLTLPLDSSEIRPFVLAEHFMPAAELAFAFFRFPAIRPTASMDAADDASYVADTAEPDKTMVDALDASASTLSHSTPPAFIRAELLQSSSSSEVQTPTSSIVADDDASALTSPASSPAIVTTADDDTSRSIGPVCLRPDATLTRAADDASI